MIDCQSHWLVALLMIILYLSLLSLDGFNYFPNVIVSLDTLSYFLWLQHTVEMFLVALCGTMVSTVCGCIWKNRCRCVYSSLPSCTPSQPHPPPICTLIRYCSLIQHAASPTTMFTLSYISVSLSLYVLFVFSIRGLVFRTLTQPLPCVE